MENPNWKELVSNIGLSEVNAELDKRFESTFKTLRDIASVCTTDNSLIERVIALKADWLPARDQYERTVIHLASMNGNTRLVRGLIYSGCPVNIRDGIGQTPLTLALHMGQTVTAKFLLETGASVRNTFFPNTIPPLEIAKLKDDVVMISLIEKRIEEEEFILRHTNSFLCSSGDNHDIEIENNDNIASRKNFSRALNINVGDQKNTVLVQGCANRCPDVYGCHTPGGGDFHNRGYVNECIARIAGPGGFWHVTEKIMKRPTVNQTSFKKKFKDNNYNNNEEALYDYDDGLSIAMVKSFQKSTDFPTLTDLHDCLERTGSHNEILLERLRKWIEDNEKNDEEFRYQSQIINDLMPLTRWYKESVRFGNGLAIEGVWMICPALYSQMGKINYRDEAFTHTVNAIAKWPRAFRLMYQRNKTVNLDGKQGRQLAGDEWVEDFLVRPVKQFSYAQSSFSMVELMSCSINLLEMNRQMYKGRESFDIHNTRKHKKPPSLYDQLKVAQFALKEEWLSSKKRGGVFKYAWADKKCKEGELVPSKYVDAMKKGDLKAKVEFDSFLHRKFPNDML